MQINWDEPRAYEYRASDEDGRVIGRVFQISTTNEYTASVGAESLGTYISADLAKQAVERRLLGVK